VRSSGSDPARWALAWARALPVVLLVPAFGLGGVAAPVRVVLGLALGACAAPALHVLDGDGLPFWIAFAREAFGGVPIALATAATLWAAVMAGGVLDTLRGACESTAVPVLEESSSPFGVMFGLLVAVGFLEAGGAERLARALAEPHLTTTFAAAAERLAAATGLALAIAAPLVVGAVLLEIGGALVARAASPAYVVPLVSALRAIGMLLVTWLLLGRIVELLVLLSTRA